MEFFGTADSAWHGFDFTGQEAFFLGYPYGLYTSFRDGKMASPLMKHAYISAATNCASLYPDGSKDDGVFLLDGLNNPGFSGGPVVAPDLLSPGHPFKLVGVISGFKNENVPLSVNGQPVPNASITS